MSSCLMTLKSFTWSKSHGPHYFQSGFKFYSICKDFSKAWLWLLKEWYIIAIPSEKLTMQCVHFFWKSGQLLGILLWILWPVWLWRIWDVFRKSSGAGHKIICVYKCCNYNHLCSFAILYYFLNMLPRKHGQCKSSGYYCHKMGVLSCRS